MTFSQTICTHIFSVFIRGYVFIKLFARPPCMGAIILSPAISHIMWCEIQTIIPSSLFFLSFCLSHSPNSVSFTSIYILFGFYLRLLLLLFRFLSLSLFLLPLCLHWQNKCVSRGTQMRGVHSFALHIYEYTSKRQWKLWDTKCPFYVTVVWCTF